MSLLAGSIVLVCLFSLPPSRSAPADSSSEALRKADAFMRRGESELKHDGTAAVEFLEALRIYRRIGAATETAQAVDRILECYRRGDDIPNVPGALEVFLAARDSGRTPSQIGQAELVVARRYYDPGEMRTATHKNERNYQKSFSHLEEARRLAKLGNDERLLADYHALKARIHTFRGEAPLVIRESREAARLYHSLGEPLQAARAQADLGHWLSENGDSEEAYDILQGALEQAGDSRKKAVRRRDWTATHGIAGYCLAALATIRKRFGWPREALRLYAEARAHAAIGPTPGQGDMLLVDMADLHSELGDHQTAERYYELALSIIPFDLKATEVWEPVRARLGYSSFLAGTERANEALVLLDEARQLTERHGTYYYRVDCLNRIGEVHLQMKNGRQALRKFDESLKLIDLHHPAVELKWRAHYGRGRSLAQMGRSREAVSEYERAIDLIRKWMRGIPQTPESPAQAAEDLWDPYREALLAYFRSRQAARAFRLSEESKSGLVTLAADPERRPLAAVSAGQASALAGTMKVTIVAYVVTRTTTIAFVIDSNGMSTIDLGIDREHLTDRIGELVNAYQSDPVGASRAGHYPPAGVALHQILFPEAIERRLRPDRTICIIPDDVLWSVPFEMLWRYESNRSMRYLIERHSICYAPSVSLLEALWRTGRLPRTQPASSLSFALIGEPDLGREGDRRDALRGEFSAGPALKNKAAWQSLFGNRSQILTRNQATEDGARRALESCDVVHLSCHGIYNESQPLYSSLVMTPDRRKGAADGLLEAREIATLRIQAQLIVLAACETGRGQVVRGHGLIGTTWAALRAGARSCIATRWQVDEEATDRLFQTFYRHWLQGQSKANALRLAQLELIRNGQGPQARFSRPYYWAGVMLMGS